MIFINIKDMAQYFNDHFAWLLCLILFIEFLLGVTNIFYANSIVEIFLRLIGWTTLRTFRMRGKALQKKKGRLRDH